MPLVKVNLLKGRSAEEKDSIAASIQTALVSTPASAIRLERHTTSCRH
jgi:phenylpyruvate tautomerase PptA (4-oxalocrotonate tautomerase family)